MCCFPLRGQNTTFLSYLKINTYAKSSFGTQHENQPEQRQKSANLEQRLSAQSLELAEEKQENANLRKRLAEEKQRNARFTSYTRRPRGGPNLTVPGGEHKLFHRTKKLVNKTKKYVRPKDNALTSESQLTHERGVNNTLVRENGRLVQENGRLVQEKGRLVQENGRLVRVMNRQGDMGKAFWYPFPPTEDGKALLLSPSGRQKDRKPFGLSSIGGQPLQLGGQTRGFLSPGDMGDR